MNKPKSNIHSYCMKEYNITLSLLAGMNFEYMFYLKLAIIMYIVDIFQVQNIEMCYIQCILNLKYVLN